MSLMSAMLCLDMYCPMPSITCNAVCGLTKLAVPMATAPAPARMNSMASSAVIIPPMPISGADGNALCTCQSILSATGFMAGPDSPPMTLDNRGLLLSISIAMPVSVFISDRASAPAPTATLAISVMSVTFGESLTINGRDVACLTRPTTSARTTGLVPKTPQAASLFGQETFNSRASTPSASVNIRAPSTNSDIVLPKKFTIMRVSY
ncbi:hypothetical protein MBAV_002246 [Candidatus Magnetobacterium bavaricum]|uniref:Uncharacterized protein n=1 Tax=Candidatus Magnetobacterium bavaricum TaxID=29290 RepID=A0A0F3GUN3_9BACT|nr:hypothetical protein MBAV_002246 [Candidatus Magnetobacterium bavaricum]